MNCRSCGAELTHTLVDLGYQPLANSYITDPDITEAVYPLHARICNTCYLVQCDPAAAPADIFTDYAFSSRNSPPWVAHCMSYTHAVQAKYRPQRVLEIGSNDGTLLKQFYQHVTVLGVDPAKNLDTQGVETIPLFFTAELASQLEQADLVIANNVIGHVPDINDLIAGIKTVLAPSGIVTIETPHLLKLIDRCEYDTIYHEHYNYWSFTALERALARHGLAVFQVEELPIHGGSIRVYAEHAGRTLGDSTVFEMRMREHNQGLWDAESPTFTRFASRVEQHRDRFRIWLDKHHNVFVAGAGAPAKANTLLNYAGVTTRDITYTTDTSPHKQGKMLPGSRIPIYPPAAHHSLQPDYIIVLAWNWWPDVLNSLQRTHTTFKFINPHTL